MKPADQTPFRGISGRNKKRCASKLPRLRRCRKYTADLLHMAVKAEFAEHPSFSGVTRAESGRASSERPLQSEDRNAILLFGRPPGIN